MGRLLSAEEARELRILRVTTHASTTELGRLYGMSETSVRDLLKKRTYKDAGGPEDDVIPAVPASLADHGTATRYNSGCRCGECAEGNKTRCRDYRLQKKARDEQAVLEGCREKTGDLISRAGTLLDELEAAAGALRKILAEAGEQR